MTKLPLLLLAGIFMFSSCEKHDPECYLPAPSFTVNGHMSNDSIIELSILENGSINLATLYESGEFHWSGPNGFESDAAAPSIPNATNAMSGEYKLTVTKGICTGSATATVAVSAVSAPCSPPQNKLTFANNIVDPATFNSIYTIEQNTLQIRASGSNCDLTIEFANGLLPQTGVYDISTNCPTSFLARNEVCVTLLYSNQFGSGEAGTVYITRQSNGKYTAVFCDVVFNVDLPFELKGSSKITEM